MSRNHVLTASGWRIERIDTYLYIISIELSRRLFMNRISHFFVIHLRVRQLSGGGSGGVGLGADSCFLARSLLESRTPTSAVRHPSLVAPTSSPCREGRLSILKRMIAHPGDEISKCKTDITEWAVVCAI